MYEAMDSYLRVDTWHTPHPLDSRRFYAALSKIVHEPDFDAEAMGHYMRDAKGVDWNDQASDFNRVIDRRVTEANAIHEFLKREFD